MTKALKRKKLPPPFDEFSEIVSELTGGRVDASVAKDSYDREDMQKPVPLLCRVHNEIHSRRPDSHLKKGRKCGCYKCHHGELGWYDDWFEAVCARKSAQNLYKFHSNCGKSKEKKQ